MLYPFLYEDENTLYISITKQIQLTDLETRMLSYLIQHRYVTSNKLVKYVYEIPDGIFIDRKSSLRTLISRINNKYSKYFEIKNNYYKGYYLVWKNLDTHSNIKYKKKKLK